MAAAKGFGAALGRKPQNAGSDIVPVWVADKKACPCGSGATYEVSAREAEACSVFVARQLSAELLLLLSSTTGPRRSSPSTFVASILSSSPSRASPQACCQPYHNGPAVPPTAEATLRGRFSAYVKRRTSYVVKTTHPENEAARPKPVAGSNLTSRLEDDIALTMKWAEYLRLTVHGVEEKGETEAGGSSSGRQGGNASDGDQAVVVCSYDYKRLRDNAGKPVREPRAITSHERALFVRHEGVWKFKQNLARGAGGGDSSAVDGGGSAARSGAQSA